MDRPLSVTALTERIKALLESHFTQVSISGEIGNLTYHTSGHIYFSLKDESSRIGCAMWRSSAKSLKFRLEEGQKVVINGTLNLYSPRGEYKLICSKITPDGVGELMLAYEQLKSKLEKLGYFDESRKKKIPKVPKHIAVVSSSTGAALQDMLRVTDSRWRLVKITLFDTSVQGEVAKNEIASNIKKADKLSADVIIVARGGGSLEDLWAFNEEIVADAIYEAKTPIVSAIGHEIDYLISDFVADLRAPTPSAAMEIVLPDRNDVLHYLDDLMERFNNYLSRVINSKTQDLLNQKEALKKHSIDAKINSNRKHLDELMERFDGYFSRVLAIKQSELTSKRESINALLPSLLNQKQKALDSIKEYYLQNEPSSRVKKGYAQISKDGEVIELKELKNGDAITLSDGKLSVGARVESRALLTLD